MASSVNSINEEWDIIVSAKSKWWHIPLKEIFSYKYLLFVFVRRDFVSVYKQTILGPLWFFIQPIFSTFIFTVVFSRVAKLPTDGVPPMLFYMSGIVSWNYFTDCLIRTSNVFVSNAGLFGKVYFPRLIVPLSNVISNLVKFLIQFGLFMVILVYFQLKYNTVFMNGWVLLTPLLLLIMAGLGLGTGIFISSLTTKYRDFQNLLAFVVQLLMYATPIVYPLSLLQGTLKKLSLLNPMTHIIEAFKYAYLGAGTMDLNGLIYSFCFMLVVVLVGVFTFSRVERNFMDTV